MQDLELPRLSRKRTSDTVCTVLRDKILTHAFRPGEQLDLRQLAIHLGVSLTPVKDAVNRLALEGLIEIRPQRGTYVTKIAPEEFAEIFEIRLALECLAAEKAVERLTPAAIRRLRKHAAQLRSPIAPKQERAAYVRNDREFHSLIVELSGNRRLKELYQSVIGRIREARLLYDEERWSERMRGASQEHAEILQAMEARDRDRLVQALRKHIKGAQEFCVGELRTAAQLRE